MNDCVFCKIVEGTIPSTQEHNDEHALIFHDIHPKARVHWLVISKKHIPTLMDLEEGDERIMGHLIRVAKETAEKHGLKGYKLIFNVGEHGGQEVFHVHMHLMSQ